MGDEGGFAPNIGSNEEGLNLVNQAIEVSALTAVFLVGLTAALREWPCLAALSKRYSWCRRKLHVCL